MNRIFWNRLLCRLAAGAALAAMAYPALAQQEGRGVRLIVPATPGGSLDGSARVLAQRMTVVTGEPHVVENRPGANTIIGVDHVVRSQPDGRTLLYTGTSVVTNALLGKLPYAPLEDLRPVMAIAAEHYSLLGLAQLKASSARDLEAIAAARPGGLNCAAPPGPMGLACEQLKARLNGRMVVVPYPGIAPAVTALGGGHVDVMFVPEEQAAKLIDSRRANVLAVTHRAQPNTSAAGAPLLTDVWPGFVMEGVVGVYVPAGMPEARIRQLHRDLSEAMSDPDVARRMRMAGMNALAPNSPENFTRLMRGILGRYEQALRKIGWVFP
jgi:tripartite-type tricarboxylate transporter receptor subunit TctC